MHTYCMYYIGLPLLNQILLQCIYHSSDECVAIATYLFDYT